MGWKAHLKAACIGVLLSSVFWGLALVHWRYSAGSLDWISWPRLALMWAFFVGLAWWRWLPHRKGPEALPGPSE